MQRTAGEDDGVEIIAIDGKPRDEVRHHRGQGPRHEPRGEPTGDRPAYRPGPKPPGKKGAWHKGPDRQR